MQTFGDLKRQARLADPARPGQRHQPMSLHRGLHLGELGLAPNEAGNHSPQVPWTRIWRTQRRKVCGQALRLDLEHLDRGRQIP